MEHTIDIHPEPIEEEPRFVNEPLLIDSSLFKYGDYKSEPEKEEDNTRVYVPLDLNREAFLRRLKSIINHYGWSTEENESDFRSDVDMLIEQIKIYDMIWYSWTKRESNMSDTRQHSLKAIAIVKEVIGLLEDIPDGCAELFPGITIDALCKEFGL